MTVKEKKSVLKNSYVPGNYVTFGSYWQSNSSTKEPIEWLVLDYDASANRALVISRYGLDAKQYNTDWTDVTWKTCMLRSWLNGEFLNAAFSTEEQKAILRMKVIANKNPKFKTSQGRATKDKVFCLSIAEANKYFKNDEARKCAPTPYAVKRDAYQYRGDDKDCKLDDVGCCWWWLRTSGYDNKGASAIRSDGAIRIDENICAKDTAIRAAIWIDIWSTPSATPCAI